MSHFYMTGVNSRGNTVSAAGARSGQDFWLRGWKSGVEVRAVATPLRDEFIVRGTGGSTEHGGKDVGKVYRDNDTGRLYFQPSELVIDAIRQGAGRVLLDAS